MMLSVVLVDPQIPPNTGNVARLCTCTNSNMYLVGNLGFFLSDKHLKRAGLDYWDELNWKYYETLNDLQSEIKGGNYYYVTTKGQKQYTEVNYTTNDILVFGSETSGLPADLLEKNHENTIRIPMVNDKRSLNLSNSVSIVLYEAIRQTQVFKDKC
ncbi:MAG: tRNA (cytidine(34)-2'-O)-methyltransferase [Vampirovibrionia bacterium]